MSAPKVNCTKCGAEILAATGNRTGGICMPCKNGAPPEWARRQLWRKRGADATANVPWYRSPWGGEIITTCQKLASGELEPIEGSRKLAEFSEIVLDAAHGEKWLHKDWAIFYEVMNEASHLPAVEAREQWSPEALESQEPRVRDIHSRFGDRVRKAALKLLKENDDADHPKKDPVLPDA